MLLVFISFASLFASKNYFKYEVSLSFVSLFICLLLVMGHLLIMYSKKWKCFTLFPCLFTTVHFLIYCTPHKCIHKMINCTPLFFIFRSGTDKKNGVELYDTGRQCIAYILRTSSRRQLVQISKRTTEPFVFRYCSRLRRSYIISLMFSCNELKLRQKISIS